MDKNSRPAPLVLVEIDRAQIYLQFNELLRTKNRRRTIDTENKDYAMP